MHCAALHIAFINANFFQGSGHGPIDFIVASGASIKDIPAQGGYQNRDILEHGGVKYKKDIPKTSFTKTYLFFRPYPNNF